MSRASEITRSLTSLFYRQPPDAAGAALSPPDAAAGAAISLPTLAAQLLCQALSCLYVRHWGALVAAWRLGAVVCRLARRVMRGVEWEEEGEARASLLKVFTVSEGGGNCWRRKCSVSGLIK